jgi:hypothetical protein
MATRAADLDNDGWISVSELHEYVSSKVQEVSPVMRPQIYAVREGYKILIAKTLTKERIVINTAQVETTEDNSIDTAVQIPNIKTNLNETEEVLKLSYTTYAILYYFSEMLERIEERKMQSLPENIDPLQYLLKEVNLQFKENKDALVKQRKLDHDPDLLRMLLQHQEGRLTWEQLTIIRQYTVNFNPAVEAVLKAEVPINLLIN